MKTAPIPSDDAARLDALRSYRVLDTPAEQSFDDLTAAAAMVAGTPVALVSLVDAERQWFKSAQGLDATETPRSISFCGHAIMDDGPLVVPNARLDARFDDNPLTVGQPHVIFYAGAPLVDNAGFRLGTLCVIDHEPRTLDPERLAVLEGLARQVVTQLELRRALLAKDDELRERRTRDQAKSRFFSMASHELRTPLTSLRGALRLIGSGAMGELSEGVGELVALADGSCDRMIALVNDVLDHARLDAGDVELQTGPVELASVVTMALEAVQQQDRAVSWIVDPASASPTVLGDHARLTQAVTNVLTHAARRSPADGVVRIQITSGPPTITIADEGPAIADEALDRVFEPFADTDGPAEDGAARTGLELAIALSIVQRHEGTIRLANADGSGSTATVVLPRLP